jgi:dolichol-phosphate mannosyltransferase
VEELNVDYGNLRVLKRKGKFGLSSAVTEGFTKAMSQATVFAVIDADLQHPPELLLAMYKKIIEGYDLVVASRYVEGGGVMKTFGLSRQFLSRAATALAHFLLPKTKGVNDVLSGFFMFKKKVLDGVELEPIGYKILLELLVKGNYSKVYEVPYIFESRKNGKSNLGFKEIKDYLFQLRMLIKIR